VCACCGLISAHQNLQQLHCTRTRRERCNVVFSLFSLCICSFISQRTITFFLRDLFFRNAISFARVLRQVPLDRACTFNIVGHGKVGAIAMALLMVIRRWFSATQGSDEKCSETEIDHTDHTWQYWYKYSMNNPRDVDLSRPRYCHTVLCTTGSSWVCCVGTVVVDGALSMVDWS
jgi:hypothetical protein